MYVILFLIVINSNINTYTNLVQEKKEKKNINLKITSHLGGGFFCEFGKVIKNIIHCEQENLLSVLVDWTDPFFPFKNTPEENGWDLFFEPIKTNNFKNNTNSSEYQFSNCTEHEIHDQECICQWILYDEYLPYRNFANQIINKYIRIKDHILDQVNYFYQTKMHNFLCIGVHIRYSSAHINESPYGHPSLDDYCQEIDKIIKQQKNNTRIKIFLATDSNEVINFLKNYYHDDILLYIDTYRSNGKEDASVIYENADYWISNPDEWHKAKPGYNGGLGVLTDCLLLSKCEYFIHISSNVATFVCFFNPNIKSIYLPRNITFKQCKNFNDINIKNPYINPV
jgi:hypothetical protein